MLCLAIITYAMNVFDMICTKYLVKQYGIEIEGNPIGKLMLKSNIATVIIKAVSMAAVLFVLYYFKYNIALIVIFAVYCALTIYHIFILIYLKAHHI